MYNATIFGNEILGKNKTDVDQFEKLLERYFDQFGKPMRLDRGRPIIRSKLYSNRQ